MKALDTPVLLAILHDSPSAKDLLKNLRGEEIATTELNMYELATLSAEGSKAHLSAREAALARLRRRITVLPITSEGTQGAGRLLRSKGSAAGYVPLVWGTLAAAGCAEWITTKAFAPPKGSAPFKVRLI
jgi:predicted nucleic acid-binding protein